MSDMNFALPSGEYCAPAFAEPSRLHCGRHQTQSLYLDVPRILWWRQCAT